MGEPKEKPDQIDEWEDALLRAMDEEYIEDDEPKKDEKKPPETEVESDSK